MTRRAGTAAHAALVVLGAVLYFLFVVPRWWVLTGQMPSTLATAGRIATGLPIALAAVPVVVSLQRELKPAGQTPELALRLRAWSAVLHLIAGALILVTAIAEIWLGLGTAGPWLFAVYGAALAIAILAVLAFYLSYRTGKSFSAVKLPTITLPKLRRKSAEVTESAEAGDGEDSTVEVTETETTGTETTGTETAAKKPRRFGRKRTTQTAVEEAAEVEITESETSGVTETVETETVETETVETETVETETVETGGLLNKRPTGKSRHRLPR